MSKDLFDKIADQLPERTDLRTIWDASDAEKAATDLVVGTILDPEFDKKNVLGDWLRPTTFRRGFGGGFTRGELGLICGGFNMDPLPKTNWLASRILALRSEYPDSSALLRVCEEHFLDDSEGYQKFFDRMTADVAKAVFGKFPEWFVKNRGGKAVAPCVGHPEMYLYQLPNPFVQATRLTQRIREVVGLKEREPFSLRYEDHPRVSVFDYNPSARDVLSVKSTDGGDHAHNQYLDRYATSARVLRSKHEDYFLQKLNRHSYHGRTRRYGLNALSKAYEFDYGEWMARNSVSGATAPKYYLDSLSQLADPDGAACIYWEPKPAPRERKDRIPHMKRGGFKGKHK